MKVKLKAQYNDGKKELAPGAEIDMNRDLAMSLLNMGMVEIINGTPTAKTGRAKPPKVEPPESDEADNENAGDEGDTGDPDNEIPDPDDITE